MTAVAIRAGSPARAFVRHFVEMLLAMLAGMAVVGLPLAGVLALAGTSWASAERDAPALIALAMGLAMTVPMAAWMLHRAIPRPRVVEMVAVMAAVTAAVMALEAAGALTPKEAVDAQHPAMIGAMLAAMLARRKTYSRAGSHSHI